MICFFHRQTLLLLLIHLFFRSETMSPLLTFPQWPRNSVSFHLLQDILISVYMYSCVHMYTCVCVCVCVCVCNKTINCNFRYKNYQKNQKIIFTRLIQFPWKPLALRKIRLAQLVCWLKFLFYNWKESIYKSIKRLLVLPALQFYFQTPGVRQKQNLQCYYLSSKAPSFTEKNKIKLQRKTYPQ